MKKIFLFTSTILGFMFTPIISISATSKTIRKITNDNDKIPIIGNWYDALGSKVNTSGIITIFEAKNGDIYVMGNMSGLEVLKEGKTNFINAPGSNIKDGSNGTIFQASNGDLYAMGKSGLEVLKEGNTHFQSPLGANINDGSNGVIFQASNGDLYVMGSGSKLQVLKAGNKSFILAPGASIENGASGAIFQASNGDIYAMGYESSLQVLNINAKKFVNAPGSKTSNGRHGVIFQASNGDIYVMGYDSGLEVLKSKEISFQTAPGTKEINNNNSGTIFQASNGDIYIFVMSGHDKEVHNSLYVLRTHHNVFVPVPGFLGTNFHGKIFEGNNGDIYVLYNSFMVSRQGKQAFEHAISSNMNNGHNTKHGGTIFKTLNGDIYVMASGSQLKILKKGMNKFENVKNSGINNGLYGVIFETKKGELYAAGLNSKLRVFNNIANRLKLVSKNDETIKGAHNGIIEFENFIGRHSIIQYKNQNQKLWKNIPSNGKIENIAPGTYNFRWTSKHGEVYANGNKYQILSDQTILSSNKIVIPPPPVIQVTSETSKGASDGIFEINNFNNAYSNLQFKLDSTTKWKNIPSNGRIENLAPGSYNFQWTSKNDESYTDDSKYQILSDQTILSSNKIVIPPPLVIQVTSETSKGASDGIFEINNFNNAYSNLQFKLDSTTKWKNIPSNGRIENLAPGTYNFQWTSKNDESYTDDSKYQILSDQTILSSNKIVVLSIPVIQVTSETSKGASDGIFEFNNFNNASSQLQFKLDSTTKWKNIPSNGRIENLAPGTYNFRWTSKHGEVYVNGNKYHNLQDQIIFSSNKIVIPPSQVIQVTSETSKGASDGILEFNNFNNAYSNLQFKLDSTTKWKNVPSDGRIENLAPGTYNFQWTGKNDESYTDDSKYQILSDQTILSSNKVSQLPFFLGISILGGLISIWLIWKFKLSKKSRRKKDSFKNIKIF